MAVYSHRNLIDKLGIKQNTTVCILNDPPHFTELLGPLPEHVVLSSLQQNLDYIHFFVRQRKDLELIFPRLVRHLKQNGMIWISWPKKSSAIETDLDENSIRDIGIEAGVVDVKVAAIDNDWSALKFVIRLKDRV